MIEHPKANGTWEQRADLACTLCARTAAQVVRPRVHPFRTTTVHPTSPEQRVALRRRQCPACGGPLTIQNVEEVFTATYETPSGAVLTRRR